MGSGRGWTAQERKEYETQIRASQRRQRNAQRALSQDLCIELMSIIQEKIIRPGPKPEERQCFDVANELTLIEPELSDLIRTRIFKNKNLEAKVRTPEDGGQE